MLANVASRVLRTGASVPLARALSTRPEVMNAEKLTSVGSRRIFNEEHDMFRESCRKWWEAEVVPNHAEVSSVQCRLWFGSVHNHAFYSGKRLATCLAICGKVQERMVSWV